MQVLNCNDKCWDVWINPLLLQIVYVFLHNCEAIIFAKIIVNIDQKFWQKLGLNISNH